MYNAYSEIFEQGDSLKKSFDYFVSKKQELKSFFESNTYDEILFVACGSSYWLSLSAAETFFDKFNIRCTAVTSGDVVMNPHSFKGRYKNPLIITPSRSGNTTETIQTIQFFKSEYNCKVLAIVEYENAKLRTHADFTLDIPWANEISVCQTRSFSNLYLSCVLIAALVKDDAVLLNDLADYIQSFKAISQQTEKVVHAFMNDSTLKNLITLGNGKLFGVMCEGAYITVEMAQAPAHFFYTLEFRHGPIVLLDERYLVVMFSSGNQQVLEEKMIADIQAKGSKVLVIAAENLLATANGLLTLNKKCSTEVVGLYGSFVTQAMAYHKALALKVNPDSPKDLVPWIQI